MSLILFVGESCTNDQYTCRNGNCVNAGLFCDGVDDCLDNSDEDVCGK